MRTESIAQGLLGGLASSFLLACGGEDLLLPSSAAPAELRVVSGDLQQAQTGARLPDPLVVEATDAHGRPVVGSRIHFRFEVASDGGQVTPDTARTDESGRATAEVRLGTAVGSHPVEASVLDGPSNLRVRFQLTALARNRAGGGGDADDDEGDGDDDGLVGGSGGGVDAGGGDDDDGGRGKGKGGKGQGKGSGDDD